MNALMFGWSTCCEIYVYIDVCMCIHACICTYICVFICIWMYVCECLFIHVYYNILYLLILSVLWILTFEQRMVIWSYWYIYWDNMPMQHCDNVIKMTLKVYHYQCITNVVAMSWSDVESVFRKLHWDNIKRARWNTIRKKTSKKLSFSTCLSTLLQCNWTHRFNVKSTSECLQGCKGCGTRCSGRVSVPCFTRDTCHRLRYKVNSEIRSYSVKYTWINDSLPH